MGKGRAKSADFVKELLGQFPHIEAMLKLKVSGLTISKYKILKAFSEGQSPAQISNELGINKQTISTYKNEAIRIILHPSFRSRYELMQLYLKMNEAELVNQKPENLASNVFPVGEFVITADQVNSLREFIITNEIKSKDDFKNGDLRHSLKIQFHAVQN